MADDRDEEADEVEATLAMPSFSLGRKKDKPAKQVAEPTPVAEPAPVREPETPREPARATAPVREAPREPEPERQPERVRRPARDVVRLPQISGLAAALVTGAVVGLLAVASVWLSTAACGAVRGTSSCGGGPGLVILVATLLLLAYLGGLMLRGFGVLAAGSTSFLGLGTAVVVLLAFFSQSFEELWMVAVAPLVTVAGYALAWWVTHQLAQDG